MNEQGTVKLDQPGLHYQAASARGPLPPPQHTYSLCQHFGGGLRTTGCPSVRVPSSGLPRQFATCCEIMEGGDSVFGTRPEAGGWVQFNISYALCGFSFECCRCCFWTTSGSGVMQDT